MDRLRETIKDKQIDTSADGQAEDQKSPPYPQLHTFTIVITTTVSRLPIFSANRWMDRKTDGASCLSTTKKNNIKVYT